jgi:hypothetical protein
MVILCPSELLGLLQFSPAKLKPGKRNRKSSLRWRDCATPGMPAQWQWQSAAVGVPPHRRAAMAKRRAARRGGRGVAVSLDGGRGVVVTTLS